MGKNTGYSSIKALKKTKGSVLFTFSKEIVKKNSVWLISN